MSTPNAFSLTAESEALGPSGSPIPSDGAGIIVCAANRWSGIMLADQHLAFELAKRVSVIYVDPPISRLAHRRGSWALNVQRGATAVRNPAPNLQVVSPVVLPGPARPGIEKITQRLLRRELRKLSRRPVRAIISAWPLYDVFDPAIAELSIFWAQDDFAAAAESWGMSRRRVARGERNRVKSADLIIAANQIVFDQWQSVNPEIDLIPYGCDAERFVDFDDGTNTGGNLMLEKPVAILVGQINFRVDLALLERIVSDGISLLLVGPVNHPERERMKALLARSNVIAVGEKSISDMLPYLKCADVGIVPYAPSAFNDASFPLKTLEYLAARLPVVSTDLPATRWLDTPLVAIARTPGEFAAMVAEQARTTYSTPLRDARWQFAQSHSYATRADAVLRAVDRSILTKSRNGVGPQRRSL